MCFLQLPHPQTFTFFETRLFNYIFDLENQSITFYIGIDVFLCVDHQRVKSKCKCICYIRQTDLDFSKISLNPLALVLNSCSKATESNKQCHKQPHGSYRRTWKCAQSSRRFQKSYLQLQCSSGTAVSHKARGFREIYKNLKAFCKGVNKTF